MRKEKAAAEFYLRWFNRGTLFTIYRIFWQQGAGRQPGDPTNTENPGQRRPLKVDSLGRLHVFNFGREPAVSTMAPQHLNGLELQGCGLNSKVFQARQVRKQHVCDMKLWTHRTTENSERTKNTKCYLTEPWRNTQAGLSPITKPRRLQGTRGSFRFLNLTKSRPQKRSLREGKRQGHQVSAQRSPAPPTNTEHWLLMSHSPDWTNQCAMEKRRSPRSGWLHRRSRKKIKQGLMQNQPIPQFSLVHGPSASIRTVELRR